MKDFVTKAEAEKMLCPYSFGATMDSNVNGINCQSSQCMAWRWSQKADPDPRADPTGFCGAFGLPKYF